MALSEIVNGWVPWASVICIVLSFMFFFGWRGLLQRADFAVQRKSRMLSTAEKNFFECLTNALSDDFYIFTKVRVLDVVESSPAATNIEKKSLMKKLVNQSLDYVLCKKHDLSIFGVVELENFEKSDDKKGKRNREKMVSEVCETANLRLFYFDIRQDYQDMDIRRLVTGRARTSSRHITPTHQSQLTIDGASTSDFAKTRACPKCHSEVVTKVAVKGDKIGEKFLMCRKYPYCDYKVSHSDANVARIAQRKESIAAKPGFRDWSAG